jgi:ABC-type glycerol-3-phosphate transport system permease component
LKTASPDQRLQRRSHARLLMPVYYIIAAVLTFYALGPLLVLVFDSLKSDTEISLNPLGPPIHPLFSNFAQAWIQGDLEHRSSNQAACDG